MGILDAASQRVSYLSRYKYYGNHSLFYNMQKASFKALRFAARWPFDSLLCSSSRGQALRRAE